MGGVAEGDLGGRGTLLVVRLQPGAARGVRGQTGETLGDGLGGRDFVWAARISTITHELGHATNVFHHGQGADYMVGAVVCRRPDGSERTIPCLKAEGCWEVAGKGGMYSGNDTCPMRYDMTNFFKDPDGACRVVSGPGTRMSPYGADPPGLGMFCSNPIGTGVNDPDNPHNKAGNATVGKCAAHIRLK